MDMLENYHMRGHVLFWHLWPICFWKLDWWQSWNFDSNAASLWCYPGTQKTYSHWATRLWSSCYVSCMTLLRGEAVLGRRSIKMGIKAFIMKPNLEALHHLAFHVRKQILSGASLVSNPTMTSCDINGEFLGHIARLSIGIKGLGWRASAFFKAAISLKSIPSYWKEMNKQKGPQE